MAQQRSKPLIIGLHGPKGSGKNFFFECVHANLRDRYDVRQIAYADPIREKIKDLFRLDTDAEYDAFKRTTVEFGFDGVNKSVKGRHLVRDIGMMMRGYDEQQFERRLQSVVAKSTPNTVWFVTDVRFQSEFDHIRSMGGLIIKIKRQGVDYDGHVSETEFADDVCDRVIGNFVAGANMFAQAATYMALEIFHQEHILPNKEV